jgi:hypothetical protein
LISARGPIGSDRSNAKLDGISAEDIEKYVMKFLIKIKHLFYFPEKKHRKVN